MILSNQARCKLCGDTPFSSHRHDFRSCECGEISVDGGTAYIRRLAKDLSNIEDMSIDLPDEACKVAIEAADASLENGDSAGSLSVVIISALGAHGITYVCPADDEGRDKVLRAVDEGSAWAIENGRNGFGALCAVARYVRDAGGSWAVPVDA